MTFAENGRPQTEKTTVDGKYITGAARNNGTALTEQLTGGGDIVEEPGDAYIESHSHERIDLGAGERLAERKAVETASKTHVVPRRVQVQA